MSTRIPTSQEIKALHQAHAPSNLMFDIVFTHCTIVAAIAAQLIDTSGIDVDRELVEAGCLLHDIGVYSLFDADGVQLPDTAYTTHGISGAEILENADYDDTYVRFASHHTGVGISEQDIIDNNMPLPVQDYYAETTEEKLVMYADKFHSKSRPPRFNSYEHYVSYVARFGDTKVAAFESLAKLFGKPNLEVLSKQYGHAIDA